MLLGLRNDRFKCIHILKIDRFNSYSLGNLTGSIVLFQKFTGSMEPVEPVLTTALNHNKCIVSKHFSSKNDEVFEILF